MAGLIPRCELVTIPVGHLVHAARAAEFTAAVRGFLRDTDPREDKAGATITDAET
jgi:3-oxoadipate enol-lactonase